MLWKAFKNVDKDNSGSINVDEFTLFLKEPKSEFTTGLFDLIDTDSSRELDFFEFASALVTFGCFTEEEMLKCASAAAAAPAPPEHPVTHTPLR